MSFSVEKIIEREQQRQFWRRIWRRVFLEDWGTKLIALGIALALWLGVTGLREAATVRLKSVTLNARASNEMEITNSPVQEVDIVVTGDKRQIDRLNTRDLVVSIDLTDIKPGDRIIQLTPETVIIELPNGVKLDEIIPNKIPVNLEKVEEREIEIKPNVEGNLPDGLEIYSIIAVPSKVRVRGAQSFVKSLDSVSTEPINLDGKTESFVASQVGLTVVNPNITLLEAIADVNFRIGERRTERMFTVAIKRDGQIETKKASVVLFGARSVIESIRPEEMHVEIQNTENDESAPRLVLPAELQSQVEIRRIKMPA